jgi:hypothetical protein
MSRNRFILQKSTATSILYSTVQYFNIETSQLVTVSIHRLELQVAQLGSRLGLGIDCVTFWSDSQTVLCWLNSKTMKFHAFVANLLSEILCVTSASKWWYVATDDNPADDCNCGLYGSVVPVTHRWFAGPMFLSQNEESWPVNIVTPEPKSADPK